MIPEPLGMIPQQLPIYSKSFITTAATGFA